MNCEFRKAKFGRSNALSTNLDKRSFGFFFHPFKGLIQIDLWFFYLCLWTTSLTCPGEESTLLIQVG